MPQLVPTPTLENIGQLVRDYMRDHAALNRLIVGQETGPRLLALCVAKAMDYANNRHARLSFTLATFPSLSLLIDLTVIEVLESVVLLKARNFLSYSDGGFTVDNEGNLVHYERVIARLRQKAESLLDDVKLSANIAGAWGTGVGSEYSWLSGWTAAFEDVT